MNWRRNRGLDDSMVVQIGMAVRGTIMNRGNSRVDTSKVVQFGMAVRGAIMN